MEFNFNIRTDKPLSAPGGQVQFTLQINLATGSDFTAGKVIDIPRTIPIATSAEAMIISIGGAGPETTGTGYIDVNENNMKFTGTAVKDNGLRIDYGTITLMFGKGKELLNVDATDTLSRGGKRWDPWQKLDRGVLTIRDGNFSNLSKAYIEVPPPRLRIYSTTIDLTERKVIWDLTATDLRDIYGAPRTIFLEVTGDTVIEEYRLLEPVGTFQVKMTTGGFLQDSSRMRHLKSNGTVCTVYVVPNVTARGERINISLTNDSTTTGFVKLRLRSMNGKDVYKEANNNSYLEVIPITPGLGPNQTQRLDGNDISKSGAYKWEGRSVLTIESNIPNGKLQVFSLLDQKNLSLMNMSTGAMGNNCD